MVDTIETLSIGQVAERTGLSIHTLRYYEREGLFRQEVRRDLGGRRVYTENDLVWLDICIKLRSSGMPLTEIRRYAELVREGNGNEAERLAILRSHQARVVSQLAELQGCLDVITMKVDYYDSCLGQYT